MLDTEKGEVDLAMIENYHLNGLKSSQNGKDYLNIPILLFSLPSVTPAILVIMTRLFLPVVSLPL